MGDRKQKAPPPVAADNIKPEDFYIKKKLFKVSFSRRVDEYEIVPADSAEEAERMIRDRHCGHDVYDLRPVELK